jgi:hypothetical protein
MKVALACVEAGLSLAEIRWVIDQRADLVERVDEFLSRTPPVDDVLNCFVKADSSMKATARSVIEASSQSPGSASQHAGVEHTAHLGMAIKFADMFVDQLIFVHGIGWRRIQAVDAASGCAHVGRPASDTHFPCIDTAPPCPQIGSSPRGRLQSAAAGHRRLATPTLTTTDRR